MNFDLTEDQVLFGDRIDRFVAEVRDQPAESIRTAEQVDLGIFSMLVPEALGGIGGTMADVVISMRGLGRIRDTGPFLSTGVIAATLIERLGSQSQRATYLPAIMSGERRFACVLDEPGGSSLYAIRHGAGFRLSGTAAMVLDAPCADIILVPALIAEEGRSAVFAIAAVPALRIVSQPLIDGRHAGDCRFDNLVIESDNVVGTIGDVRPALDEARDRGRTALCADAVGAMAELLAVTEQHLTSRKQFRAPLATFQLLRHRFVDMVLQKELAETMMMVAAMACDEAGADRGHLVRLAKAKIGFAGRFVGEWAVQMHGAMGVTEEHAAGQLYKRLLVDDVLLGSIDATIDELAATLPARAGARSNSFLH
jgi:pimeloyl-CoA dehydrogenase